MRCRHFTLRLSPEHAGEDEATLNEFMGGVDVRSVQTVLGAPGRWSVLVFFEQEAGSERYRPPLEPVWEPQADTEPPLTAEALQVYDRLRIWRKQRAGAEGKPPYIIANNATLMEIARRHMSIHAADDLAGIKQFGPARAERYGPDLLRVLTLSATRDEEPLFDDQP